MMSKKWAFSLTSLITILALAFVATPAMAADDFDAALSVDDVSHIGDSQSQMGLAIAVTLTFGEKVSAAAAGAAKISVRVEDMNGNETVSEITGTDVATGITPKDIDTVTTGDQFNGKTYKFTIPAASTPAGSKKVYLFIPAGVKIVDPGSDKSSKKGALTINLVAADPTDSDPDVVMIKAANALLVPDAGFSGDSFDVVITLSERPKENKLTKDHIAVDKGTAGDPVYLGPIAAIDGKDDGEDADTPTGRDGMHHQYLVKITPKNEDGDLVVKVKEFEDNHKGDVDGTSGAVTPASTNKYMPPAAASGFSEGYDKLTVKIKRKQNIPKVAGVKFGLPKDKIIPAGGYLIVAEDKGGSSVHVPPGKIDESPKAHERTPAEQKYNVIDDGDLPNLETFLSNGGVIGVMGPRALMITEIMWGSDASLDDPGKSQWLELYNAGTEYKTQDGDNTTYLVFYGPGEAPATGLHDTVGTVDTTGYWSIAGKGQSGRSGKGEKAEGLTAVVPTTAIISMSRMMSAGTLASGTMASSWVQSTPPSSNFDADAPGAHIGTPGAMPVTFPAPPPPPPEVKPAPVIPVAEADDIMITEIMVDTGNSRLPQWIELTNVSGAEKSLAGWSVQISNSGADADAVGGSVSIDLMGTLGVGGGMDAGGTMGKSLLLVAWSGRKSSNLEGNERVVDVSGEVGQRGRYKLISDMAFMIALIPPQKTGVLTYGDTAGNLGATEAWDLPMSDNGRSSLIRREMLDDGMATMGTDANGWVLASSTGLVSGPATWYGSDEDAGTPGYDAGGPLPVELSHFRPARDKQTGAVVITWATESELNNAGFFIKRSNQRNGEFKVINATMVPGAGTTSEKQFYTYTDTTAQPNVVYYYQIEDVSLDGNRQTLTRGIRLKGHVGAAGKATVIWGELKTSHE